VTCNRPYLEVEGGTVYMALISIVSNVSVSLMVSGAYLQSHWVVGSILIDVTF
jgi:hypothetical protein